MILPPVPVKPEPSPSNEPLNAVIVSPNATEVSPIVILSFVSFAFAIPPSAIVAVIVCAEADSCKPSCPVKVKV